MRRFVDDLQHHQHPSSLFRVILVLLKPPHDPKLQLPGRELPEGAEHLGDSSQAGRVQVGADHRHDQVVGAREEAIGHRSARTTGC
jgi:hypothetical protein